VKIRNLFSNSRSRSARRRTTPANIIRPAAACTIEPLEHRVQLSGATDPNADNPFLYPADECGVVAVTTKQTSTGADSTGTFSTASAESSLTESSSPESFSASSASSARGAGATVEPGGAYIGVGGLSVNADNSPIEGQRRRLRRGRTAVRLVRAGSERGIHQHHVSR
jgi:hypothetical protein